MMVERPSCWILSDGTIGMEIQCIALAEALGLEHEKKHIKPYWLNRIFPSLAKLPGVPLANNHMQVTSHSSPDILITCGRRHAGASIALKRLSNGTTYTIHIQDPKINPKHFDLLIIPEHDMSQGPNIIPSKGSLTRITKSILEKEAQLIEPKINFPNHKAKATSVGAFDIINKAKVFNETNKAISNFDIIVSLSARRRDINKRHISLNDFVKLLKKTKNSNFGLMFGPEASGLSNEDISFSNYVLQIPTSPKFKSLNLSHSLTIICYEIFKIFNEKLFEINRKNIKI